MKCGRVFVLIVLIAALANGCDEDDERIVNSYDPFMVGDLVHFDTDSYVMTVTYSAQNYPSSEGFVRRDLIIGEPFVDIDGDGVYDPDIDIFCISADTARLDTAYYTCDSIADTICYNAHWVFDSAWGYDLMRIYVAENHDINYNGIYDGPKGTWTPGVPFVDFDGDGVFDYEYIAYQAGLPFADFNGNGTFESSLPQRYGIGKYRVENYGTEYQYSRITMVPVTDRPAYRYTVKLGNTYDMASNWVGVPALQGHTFELDSTGFWYRRYNAYPALLVLENGSVHWRPRSPVVISSRYSEMRSVSLNESLQIGETQYSGLVVVDITKVFETADTTQWLDYQARFYFSPNELHLLALRLEPPDEDSVWIYLDRRLDTLPLPMIR